jgi:L-asparaginase
MVIVRRDVKSGQDFKDKVFLTLSVSRWLSLKNEIIPISLITTGGTIEKKYDESEGTLVNKESLVKNTILNVLRLPYSEITLRSLLSKDSLQFTDEDRSLLLSAIKEELGKNRRVLVLHGTDTMAISAKYCFDNLKNIKLPVVFTGAMKPIGFLDSDATQNVVEGLLAVKILSPGIYLSFHNKIFTVPNVQKNKSKGTFEET